MGKTVIICGGGVMGLCTAYYLAREGVAVTIIEKRGEKRDHCALGSAGYVSPSHVIPLATPGMVWKGLKWMLNSRSPFYVQPRLDRDLLRWGWLFWRASTDAQVRRSAPILRDLCLASRQLYVELDEHTESAFEFKTEGLLNLCKTQEGLDDEANGLAKLANELGVEARVLNAQQTAALEPGTKLAIAGSVYFPIDAHVTPARFADALTILLKQLGVTFRWNTSVVGWRTEGSRIVVVRTDAGELTADEYVLTGGSWSPGMVKGLGLRLPMQAGKGYSLTLSEPRFHLTKPMILKERRIAITPMGNTLRFGGTMELSGINDIVRPERVQQIIDGVPHYFPEFTPDDFAGIQPWQGLRPVSPDGMPYIGRFNRYNNLSTASGHAMLGLTLAPISGLLLAEVLAGRTPSVALSQLDPNRFS